MASAGRPGSMITANVSPVELIGHDRAPPESTGGCRDHRSLPLARGPLDDAWHRNSVSRQTTDPSSPRPQGESQDDESDHRRYDEGRYRECDESGEANVTKTNEGPSWPMTCDHERSRPAGPALSRHPSSAVLSTGHRCCYSHFVPKNLARRSHGTRYHVTTSRSSTHRAAARPAARASRAPR
jgi:hypothetical protein